MAKQFRLYCTVLYYKTDDNVMIGIGISLFENPHQNNGYDSNSQTRHNVPTINGFLSPLLEQRLLYSTVLTFWCCQIVLALFLLDTVCTKKLHHVQLTTTTTTTTTMIQHPTIRDKIRRRSSLTSAAMHEDSNDVNAASSSSTTMIQLSGRDERERIVVWRSISCHHESNRRLQMFSPRVYHHRSPPGVGVTAWRRGRGRHHQHHHRRLTFTTSIVTLVTMMMMMMMIVLTPPPQSSSSSSSLLLFVSAGNYNNNYNNAANNANQNYQGDDQYSQNTDDGQNDDGNNNNNNNDNNDAEAGSTTAATAREWNDDLFDWDVPNQDGFHSLSIMPVSCIN